jgi:hypothetical protein
VQTGQRFPIENSNLFKLHELEEKEIAVFRWLESEKQGFDIGDHRAHWLWWAHRRDAWRRALKASGIF